MRSYDAAIIGGGIIGCAIARSLAGAQLKVAVIERGTPGKEASWAAAGMLSPSAEAEVESPLFAICRASLQMYRSFAVELESETGIDAQYRTEGTLLLFEDEVERETMLASIEWQRNRGLTIDELSRDQLQRLEPSLGAVAGGFHLAEDHQIDNRLLVRSLIDSCERRGVQFIQGRTVHGVAEENRRVAGVSLEDEVIAAPRVVNTAGAWAASVEVAGFQRAPIRPVKGHIVSLAQERIVLRHVVRSKKVYLVPRHNGQVIVGSTMEEAGFDKTAHAGPIARLLRSAHDLCPLLEQSTIRDFWAGLRPATPDGLPMLGPAALEGYWTALGHFRNGILLTPITAKILSSWITTGQPSFPVNAFSPDRFDNGIKP